MPPLLTLRDLTLATLHRQFLIDRTEGSVADVIGRLAGLQAQHASWPYIALWSRRDTKHVGELEAAITDASVVKATVMRTTLHLVDAADLRAYDAMTATGRVANWQPSATRAGLDLLVLNADVRAFCHEPRTVADIEAHVAAAHPGLNPYDYIPGGVSHAWFRLGTAAGGLVHVPPSGLWAVHDKPRYVDVDVWLGASTEPTPTPEDALQIGVERFLAAYGPATLADIMQWSGQRRRGVIRTAVNALGDKIVERDGPDGEIYLDLAGLHVPDDDHQIPARFLARWDGLLFAYDKAGRNRIIRPEHVPAVYKKNGDALPTFLVDGMVTGVWSYETVDDRATLRIEPLAAVPAADRAVLTDEAERLVCYVAPEADRHAVIWAS